MQAQRFWIERAFQDAKSHIGMAQYQARQWPSWHRPMALVMMAMLFPDPAGDHLAGPARQPGRGVETDATPTPTASIIDRLCKPGVISQVIDMTAYHGDQAELSLRQA